MNSNLEKQEQFWKNAERNFRGWGGRSRLGFLRELLGYNRKKEGMVSNLKAMIRNDLGEDEESISRYNAVCGMLDKMAEYAESSAREIDDLDSFVLQMSDGGQSSDGCVPLDTCILASDSGFCQPGRLFNAGYVLDCVICKKDFVKVLKTDPSLETFIQLTSLQEVVVFYQSLFAKAKAKQASSFEKQVLTVLTEMVRGDSVSLPLVFMDKKHWKLKGGRICLGRMEIPAGRDSVVDRKAVQAIPGLSVDLHGFHLSVAQAGSVSADCYLFTQSGRDKRVCL